MKATKKEKLQKAGWAVGSASEFLELSDAESTLVEIKLALAAKLKEQRRKKRMTQQQLAERIGSSQSRVAKIETAEKSVSIDLIVRTLISLGTSQSQIGETICDRCSEEEKPKPSKRKKRDTVPS